MSGAARTPTALVRNVATVVPFAWFVALTVVVGGVTGFFVATTQPATYRAHGSVLVELRAFPLVPASGQPAGTATLTEIAVLEGTAVRRRVADDLGDAPPISTAATATSRAVVVSAEDTDPQRAARIVNAYMSAYVESRRDRVGTARTQLIAELEASIAGLDERLDALQQRVLDAPEGPERQAVVRDITAERRELAQQHRTFTRRLDELTLVGSGIGTDAQVLLPALAPTAPVAPARRQSALLGSIGGLVLGIGLVLLRRHLDTGIRDGGDLVRIVHRPVAVLGRVPALARAPRPGPLHVLAPTSAGAEAYRAVRTALHFAQQEQPFRSLLVTSSVAGEGTTSTVVNLAAALGRRGQRVVMVDADLRNGSLHTPFGASGDTGLVSVLLGEGQPTDLAQPVGAAEHLPLNLLAAGGDDTTPAELLASGRTRRLLDALGDACDVVLIDSPPVLLGADAVVLSSYADAVLLVVRAGSTSGRNVRAALDRLHRAGARVVGVVLNRVDDPDQVGPSDAAPHRRDAGSLPGRALRTAR